jgi:ribosomal protein L2
MGIRAVHVVRFQATDGGTLARSEESWEGLLAGQVGEYLLPLDSASERALTSAASGRGGRSGDLRLDCRRSPAVPALAGWVQAKPG